MKKGEVISLDIILGKVNVPEMKPDQLYNYLSMKVDLEKQAQDIQSKAEALRKKTKPEEVDENQIDYEDPKVKEWEKQYKEMYVRLMDEPYDGPEIKPCIDKECLVSIMKGLTTNEAAFIFKYISKKC